MSNLSPKPENPLQERVRLHMEKELVPTQIKTLAANAFANFLRDEPVVLTRNEKRHLYQTIVKEIFDNILDDL